MNRRYMDKVIKHCQINYFFKANSYNFSILYFIFWKCFIVHLSSHQQFLLRPPTSTGSKIRLFSPTRWGWRSYHFPCALKGSSSLPVSVVRSASSQGSVLAVTAFLRRTARTLPNNCWCQARYFRMAVLRPATAPTSLNCLIIIITLIMLS